MADSKNLAVRLSVIDGGKTKAELAAVGQEGQKALSQIERGAKPASDGLDRVARSAENVGKSTPAISSLSHAVSGFVGGLAAGAVTEGINLLSRIPQAFGEILRATQEAEDSQRRLNAVLQGTGFTAGLTTNQLIAFADEQERATLNTAEQVQDAAAVLATFRSVAGDTFTRTIKLAADMAAVFGGDLSQNVTRLGKALEDPVAGIGALSRVGVSFNAVQKDMIASLVESGQQLEAQRTILAAIEGQLGPAAAAQNSGTTGAANALADAWGELIEALGQTSTIAGGVQTAFGAITAGLKGLTAEVSGEASSIEERFRRAQETLNGIREYKEKNPILGFFSAPGAESIVEAQVEALRGPLQEQLRIRLLTQEAEERSAEAAFEKQQEEQKLNTVLLQRKNLEEELVKLRNSPDEQRAKITAELEATRKKLEGSRTDANSEEVNIAVAQAEEIARRRGAIIDAQIARERAAEESKAEAAVKAAERASEAQARAAERVREAREREELRTLEAVTRLEDAYTQLTGTQIANIDLALQRQLEANAREIESAEMRTRADVAATAKAEVEKARLRDETLRGAQAEVTNARIAANELLAKSPKLSESERTQAAREGMELRIALEREETTRRLESLALVGLSEADYARAREDYLMASAERIRVIEEKAKQDQEKNLLDASKLANQFSSTLSGGIAELVLQGKEGFDSLNDAFQTFLDGIQRQLIQQGTQALIGSSDGKGGGTGLIGLIMGLGPLVATGAAAGVGAGVGGGTSTGSGGSGGGGGGGGGGGSGGGSINWDAFHTGGVVGKTKPYASGSGPSEWWKNAPRYHQGRGPLMPALAPWEEAAILRKDETVSTPAQVAAMGKPAVNIIINNNSSEPVNSRQVGGDTHIDIGHIVANALSKPGSPANQMVRSLVQSEMRSGG